MYNKRIAIDLSLKYQLLLFGFLLSIRGFCALRQCLLCATFCQIRIGRSTLQNLDSILRKSPYDKTVSMPVRTTLLALIGLPLLLSALYKLFIHGSTRQSVPGISGLFGIIPPPSLNNLRGNGIILAVHAIIPFSQSPQNHNRYGENKFVVNERTTAMLDTPYPSLYTTLRRSLGEGDSYLLESNVTATVSNGVEISPEERANFAKTYDSEVISSS